MCSQLKWWTNGEKVTRAKECPGEGWMPGRNGFSPTKGKKLSQEQKDKISKTITGKKKWNNGIKNVYAVECPGPGYISGFIPRKKPAK